MIAAVTPLLPVVSTLVQHTVTFTELDMTCHTVTLL